MKNIIAALWLFVSFVVVLPRVSVAETEKEKAFVEAYKKAFESKDEAGLQALLYTKGADPTVLGFYTMMMTSDMGNKISSIKLVDLTAEDKKKAAEIQPLPDGKPSKLPLTPSKKLVVAIETHGASGNSTSTSESFVAEADGKLVIPVPGPAK